MTDFGDRKHDVFHGIQYDSDGPRAVIEVTPRTFNISVAERRVTSVSEQKLIRYMTMEDLEDRYRSAMMSDDARHLKNRDTYRRAVKELELAINGIDTGQKRPELGRDTKFTPALPKAPGTTH